MTITPLTIKPLDDRVLIQTDIPRDVTSGGLIIPEIAQLKTQNGTIAAIGPNKEKINVSIGQRVMYDKFAGHSIKMNERDHILLRVQDIMAILE